MVTIIIVNYQVKKELFNCIASIYNSKTKIQFEIIVVDNDEKKTIKRDLLNSFPKVLYVPNVNKGFGQANNIASKKAKGEYLFFLNPDTKVYPGTIDTLVEFLKKEKQSAIVAPLLVTIDGKPYTQGTLELTPLRAVFALSFINKLFPKNSISKEYWLRSWNWKSKKEVAVVPGTAFLISKKLFISIGGFDENFFLYFEEFDLCRRIKKLGFKLFIIPQAKVAHHWGSSTNKRTDIQKIFKQSRFYYFRKHFGLIAAILTEGIVRINKYNLILFGAVLLGAYLRLFNIQETMNFIGDQGWFYLSARDFVQYGTVPLVGIASSHPWLHQGAYWTYMLAAAFSLFGFSPFIGAYVSIGFDILGIIAIYFLGTLLLSQRLGSIAAILYAISPLVIFNARMPYHTSLVPLLTILVYYSLIKLVKGQKYFFPILIFLLAVIYNFVLVSFLLSSTIAIILIYGLIKQKNWAKAIFEKKVLLLSLLGFVLPMMPMLIYDVFHGFPQTLKLLVWIGYRILVFFGYPPINPSSVVTHNDMATYFSIFISQLIFPNNNVIALVIALITIIALILLILKKMINYSLRYFIATTIFLTVGIILAKTPSGAYLPILYPGILLLIAVVFDNTFRNKITKYFILFILLLIIIANSQYMFKKYTEFDDNLVNNRIKITKEILKQAEGKAYNLVVETPQGHSVNFAKNYEYLAWYFGHGPSEKKQKLLIVVEEKSPIIKVRKDIIK